MKKLLIGAVAAAALSFGFAGPASATSFSDACKAVNNLGVSHGECVSIYTAFFNKGKGNNDVSAYCKWLKEFHAAIFDANFKNHGECVKALAPSFPG